MRLPALIASACLAGAAYAQQPAPPAQPPAPPPCSAPEYRQMDFWAGDWDLEFTNPNGTIGHARNRITRDEYGPCAIAEHFVQPGGAAGGGDYVGGSYSMYDPLTGKWRQMWVDNGGGVFDLAGGPVTGQKQVFELVTTEPRGANRRLMRMIWEDVAADRLVWRWQAQQPDGSWSDQWVLRYRRRPPG